jgi:hypothetical protein
MAEAGWSEKGKLLNVGLSEDGLGQFSHWRGQVRIGVR